MYEAAAAVIRHSFANCRVKHLGYVVWEFFLAFYSCNSFIIYEKWKLQLTFSVVWVLLFVLKCIFLVKCVSTSGVWLQKKKKKKKEKRFSSLDLNFLLQILHIYAFTQGGGFVSANPVLAHWVFPAILNILTGQLLHLKHGQNQRSYSINHYDLTV